MSSWNQGYTTEIDYTHGYYTELAPWRLRMASLMARCRALPSLGAPTFLELGYGQGVTLAMNAAANPGHYFGTDFNPAQAAHAQTLIDAAGADATLYDDSFQELAERRDLPQFDVIALHGIYSWIPDDARDGIHRLIRSHLKPGGLLYISYNCPPGWSPASPLRHLLALHFERGTSPGTQILKRTDQSLEFVQTLVDANIGFFKAYPAVAERLKRIKEQDRVYVTHEFFNSVWQPIAFSDMHRQMADLKLTFVGSAALTDYLDAINLTADGQKILAGLDDTVLRETVRDYLTNQQFRRDLFVRGRRTLSMQEFGQALRQVPVMLVVPTEDVPKTIKGALGEANLQPAIYEPLIERLAAEQGAPRPVGEILADPTLKAHNAGSLIQAITVLMAMGSVQPVHDPKTSAAVAKRTRALNAAIMLRSETHVDQRYLASPVTGLAHAVGRVQQLFLRAQHAKHKDPVQAVWGVLAAQGHRVMKDGKALETAEENLAELRDLYQTYETRQLPILKRLGIA